MNRIRQLWIDIIDGRYGRMATAAFLICTASGVLLAVPYDILEPYASLRTMLLLNKPAAFSRNVHYWSAQLFLVLMLLHTWQHLYARSETRQGTGVWFRLTLSLLFAFYIMLSGFLLRGDGDALQARGIFESILSAVPVGGETLRYLIFGEEESLILTYVHHIATATVFLLIVIWEHARNLWTGWRIAGWTMAVVFVLSFGVMAPLHDGYNPVVKGPWYFLGLQEILHYFPVPAPVVWAVPVLLILLFLLKWMNPVLSRFTKYVILAGFIVYLVFSLIAFAFRGVNWQWEWPWNRSGHRGTAYFHAFGFFTTTFHYHPAMMELDPARRESCMHCHYGFTGLSASHDPAAIGCSSCHGGNPLSMMKKQAHQGMVLIPGNLSDASRSCGTSACHPELVSRVGGSIMTTCSGLVSVDRFVFGEQNTPDSLVHIDRLGQSAADIHMRNLCAGCHLGKEKTSTGKTDQLSRGGGCLACHLSHGHEAERDHFKYRQHRAGDSLAVMAHPDISIRIGNEQCFGCHSRSGRIATNYQGWHETMHRADSLPEGHGSGSLRVLQDRRVFEYRGADVHFQRGLACIDCHGSYELMGDGKSYMHKEDQVKSKCIDCHAMVGQDTLKMAELRGDDARLALLRRLERFDHAYYRSASGGEVLLNLRNGSQGERLMTGKNSGTVYNPRPTPDVCSEGKAHDRLECRACHTAWAPRCIGCHNTFEAGTEGFDHLKGSASSGKWTEYAGKFESSAPTLGIIRQKGSSDYRIGTFVPGMVISIDKGSFYRQESSTGLMFRRLYAPISAHTTAARGRDCASCHCDPIAMGYGAGRLSYRIGRFNGKWEFMPRYANNPNDGLPEDAWIGFMQQPSAVNSTRTGTRPFSIAEQRRMLLAGSCLQCHEPGSGVMKESLHDFDVVLKRVSPSCKLPVW